MEETTITQETKTSGPGFMAPSKMAKCFGVSLPTFLEWMQMVLVEIDENDESNLNFFVRTARYDNQHNIFGYKYSCVLRIITPDEVKKVCRYLGDPEYKLNYKKTTLSSLAKEAGISMKTAMRIKKQVMNEETVYNWEKAYKTRCLIPKNVKIFREKFGLSLQD